MTDTGGFKRQLNEAVESGRSLHAELTASENDEMAKDRLSTEAKLRLQPSISKLIRADVLSFTELMTKNGSAPSTTMQTGSSWAVVEHKGRFRTKTKRERVTHETSAWILAFTWRYEHQTFPATADSYSRDNGSYFQNTLTTHFGLAVDGSGKLLNFKDDGAPYYVLSSLDPRPGGTNYGQGLYAFNSLIRNPLHVIGDANDEDVAPLSLIDGELSSAEVQPRVIQFRNSLTELFVASQKIE